jgi:hypothetical protein
VYHERRFGPAAAVRGHEVRDFLRFIAQRWQAPEWQVEQARAALEGKAEGKSAGGNIQRPTSNVQHSTSNEAENEAAPAPGAGEKTSAQRPSPIADGQ